MGQLEDLLSAVSPPPVFVDRWNPGDATFTPSNCTGLIILGDGETWATSDRYSLDRSWLEAAIEHGLPVLGICFGAQLLAAHLDRRTDGKPLSSRRSKDHYKVLCHVEVADRDDPVVGHLADGTPVAQYHEDHFGLPTGGTPLAWSTGHSSRRCEAFRLGEREAAVYGVQFHPEPSAAMLADTRRNCRWLKEIPEDTTVLERTVAAGRRLLAGWIELAVKRDRTRRS